MEKLEQQQQRYPFKVDSLLKFGTDLTSMATMGKLDPIVGRQVELERLTQVLCKRRKNNACLVGHPGVGKTVVVEGLAIKIANGTVLERMIGKKVFAIDMGRLVAGTKYRGQLEKRMVDLVDEVVKSEGSVILFIDEFHSLIGAKGAANILKPALARGELKCIGATTFDEYREYIERDPALKRRFQSIDVLEPSPQEAIEILRGVRSKYEAYHGVSYTDEVLNAALDLSKQYVSEGYLPDKTVDLIDEAGARVSLRKEKSCSVSPVTIDDLQQVLSMWTGIPLQKVSTEESCRLLGLEKPFNQSLIGQEDAVSAVSRAIRRARVGLRDMDQPVASFLFTGPTGVGKTELVKILAAEYYGSKEAMVRLDMSEYMESHSVSRIFGSPPGYIGHEDGGQLTEAVRRKPHTVVLFDEIEKAHSQVFNVLLQILGDGRLTDSKGRQVDFKHTIIIFTSNIGGQLKGSHDEVRRQVSVRLKEVFKPEFLNRLDEIVVFRQLEKFHLGEILETMLVDFHRRADKKGIKVEVSDELKEKLVTEGWSSNYGARPLRRAITRLLEDNLAESILNGSVSKGQSVKVDVDSENGEVIMRNC